MAESKSITLNPSLKHHFIIGGLLSLWGFMFSYFIRPFAHGDMDTQKWIFVSLGFSVFVFIAYAMVGYIQRFVYRILGRWNIPLEIGAYLLFYLLYSLLTFAYYRSSLIEGFYDFSEFLSKIILNIFLIVAPILFIARRYSLKFIPTDNGNIVLKGVNKLDVLKISQSNLVCVSNAQNYVEIFYLEKDELKSKLLRSSLKRIEEEHEFLIKVHRSHLINPTHFQSWLDSKTISLTHMEVPVAKTYKNDLLSL